MIKNTGIEGRVITAASAAAEKLGLKVKQMDVVGGILSERDVLIKRCGKSLLRSPTLLLIMKTLFIFSITSSGYHVATAKTQQRFSSIMRIQPTTVKQLSHSLEIEMAQVVKKTYIYSAL